MLVVTITESGEVLLTRDGETLGRVTVSRKGDGKIRLGLDFPKEIKITRKELLDRQKESTR